MQILTKFFSICLCVEVNNNKNKNEANISTTWLNTVGPKKVYYMAQKRNFLREREISE